MSSSNSYPLRLVLFNMRSGHTVMHEINLNQPPSENGCYKAYLPHTLYHRIKAHFGKGPFTTSFTLSHGPFMLHGYIKTNQNKRLTIEFDEEEKTE